MIDFNNFLKKTEQKMASKYRVFLNVELPNNSTADLTASRTYFSWKGLVIISQHMLIAHIENAKVDDIQQLFDNGFDFAKKNNRIPLLRGMQFGYTIIPVIATSNPSKELIEYATSKPRKHWSLFEFPVVLDLNSGEVHYYHNTSMWGAFYFSDMRKVVSEYIKPAKG